MIDIFAGPGGLSEGFSSIFDEDGKRVFDIKLSIEKDTNAHETLRLRSFFRQFNKGCAPDFYYDIVKQISWKRRKKFINELKEKYQKEWDVAEKEAWHFELPYPEEFDKNGKKKGGYTPKQIEERNEEIDSRIKDALGGEERFILIGGPPCQAFSLAGRSRNQGISEKDHRVHLYKEYLRIIAKHHPAVFVMENVKGLLSSKVDGVQFFDLMKKDLGNPSSIYPDLICPEYKIYSFITGPDSHDQNKPVYKSNNNYLIKSEKYGVPQKRHRVILLGIREDLEHPDQYLKTKDMIDLHSIIGKLPNIRSAVNRSFEGYHTTKKYANGKPKRLYKNLKDSNSLWETLMSKQIKKIKKWGDLQLNGLEMDFKESQFDTGSEFVKCKNTIDDKHQLSTWYLDPKLDGVANHESRSHLTQDLMRYMFAVIYLQTYGEFPRMNDYAKYHKELLPDHENAKSGDFTDRFRVQLEKEPATTITSHISKDGHYFIHYDPKQCRSLTVREAARIQTFPDNYLFCGSRTAQYHQVGNAVPPYLAYQMGKIVKKVFEVNDGEINNRA